MRNYAYWHGRRSETVEKASCVSVTHLSSLRGTTPLNPFANRLSAFEQHVKENKIPKNKRVALSRIGCGEMPHPSGNEGSHGDVLIGVASLTKREFMVTLVSVQA